MKKFNNLMELLDKCKPIVVCLGASGDKEKAMDNTLIAIDTIDNGGASRVRDYGKSYIYFENGQSLSFVEGKVCDNKRDGVITIGIKKYMELVEEYV